MCFKKSWAAWQEHPTSCSSLPLGGSPLRMGELEGLSWNGGIGSLYPTSGATNSSPLKTRNKTHFISQLEFGSWSDYFSPMSDWSGNILSEVEEGYKLRTRKQKNYYTKIITWGKNGNSCFSDKFESLKAQDDPRKYSWLLAFQGGGLYPISYDVNISQVFKELCFCG